MQDSKGARSPLPDSNLIRAPFPRHSAASRAPPAIESDRERQRVPKRMKKQSQPRRAKTHGQDQANQINQHYLRRDPSFPRDRQEEQQARQQEAAHLRRAYQKEVRERLLEDRAQIFGKAFPHFAERSVHAARRKILRLAVAQPHSLTRPRRHSPSQRHVLDDMIPQRRVSADSIVARTGEEHELAIRRAEHASEPRGKKRVEPWKALEKDNEPVWIK